MKKSIKARLDALKSSKNTPEEEQCSRSKPKKKGEKERIEGEGIERLRAFVSQKKDSLASRLKEMGVDPSSLSEESVEAEESETLLEKVKKAGKGNKKKHSVEGELEETVEKRGAKTQPQPESGRKQPKSALSVDVDAIIEDMPESSKDLNKGIMSYLNKLEYLALARAEEMLKNPALFSDPAEMVKLATSLRDMKLTIKWTKKLEDVILNNPSKMKPPGVGGQFRLLDRLASVANATKKEQEMDGRKSGIKQGRQVELELPVDDVPNKQVGGA